MRSRGVVKLLVLFLLLVSLPVSTIACSGPDKTQLSFVSPVPTDNVVVNDSLFSPVNIIIALGTSVTWTNQDEITYFIVDNDQSFAFNIPAEGSFSMTFTDTGVFNYHCAIHPHMLGTITVVNGTVV